jgi:pyruvate dehydrogenase E1 component alpha subunit
MDTVASFSISRSQFLDTEGNVVAPLPSFADDPDVVRELYRAMQLTRELDSRAVTLQRTGQLGTYPSSLGQEAVSVGLGSAMRPEDVLVPSFREQGAQLVRGVSLVELLLFWGGDERGSDFANARQDFPVCVPVGTQAAHAAGVALAFRLRGEARAVVCVVGDGGTSKGDVYEAMNCAGVWGLPVVFLVNNNQWAISVPRREQSAADTLAQKAIAAGFVGEQVDGNDVIAVRQATSLALERARAGEGPRLIEALTYRLADHTTADDATRYRSDADVSDHWREDPLARMRGFLTAHADWDRDKEASLVEECRNLVEEAVAAYLATPPQPPEAMFDFLYAELPESLRQQRDALLARAAEGAHGNG